MRKIFHSICDETDPRALALAERMIAFYARTEAYDAFREPSRHPQFWSHVLGRVRAVVAEQGRCRVLEFGAGMTSFADVLAELRPRMAFEVQDVTTRNRAYLDARADRAHLGDILAVSGRYDVIFSTFAWEHVTRPRAILEHLLSLLGAQGRLFLACPRYDFPFYLSPSARHLPGATRVALSLWLLWWRLRTLTTRRAAFLLHTEPAALHGPWFRDADAVHWASLWDLECALQQGWQLKRLRIRATGLLGRFWEKYLVMFVEISRRAPAGGA
ncbi:MAG: methyltransferase domain-containing protein [Burkholderiales bacterium]|nr:methyltransferase domain-containing protein [Burkholderiales bacterium]